MLERQLTERQKEVFDLLLTDLSIKEIGERLYVSPRTIESHTKPFYDVYGVSSRNQLLAKILSETQEKLRQIAKEYQLDCS